MFFVEKNGTDGIQEPTRKCKFFHSRNLIDKFYIMRKLFYYPVCTTLHVLVIHNSWKSRRQDLEGILNQEIKI